MKEYMINEGITLFSKKTHSDACIMFVIHYSAPQARFFMIPAFISIFFAPAARLNNPGAPVARQKISRLFLENPTAPLKSMKENQ